MTHYRYERLTGLDSTFLVMESADTPMHVASVAVFEPGPLQASGGGVDFERIAAHIATRLPRIPRYREKLAYIPLEGHPVWVDDARFNLAYHLRHTALPQPGDQRQLKRLCARIMSQQLDRLKPLWETWIVEGYEGGVAMISKTHHCMIDGISGVDLLTVLLSDRPDAVVAEEPPPWVPRPRPRPATLFRDELLERLRAPLGVATRLLREPLALAGQVRTGAQALVEMLSVGAGSAGESPFNQPIGSHRRFDWTAVDLGAIRDIRGRLGGSINDVVLAIVAGAVRRFFERRGLDPAATGFRAFVPVSTRPPGQRGTLGNQVAAWIVDLPIGEGSPATRLQTITEATAHLRSTQVARGSEILTEMADWTGSTVVSLAMRLAARATPFNLVVTNVPGPPVPLYLLGARMVEAYPMVPLFINQALGIALFSNAGRLFWGFNADWDALPDLHDFVAAVDAAFAELQEAAALSPALPARRARRARRTSGLRA